MHDKLIIYWECIKVWLVLVHRSDQKFRATDSAIWLGLIVSCAVKSFEAVSEHLDFFMGRQFIRIYWLLYITLIEV